MTPSHRSVNDVKYVHERRTWLPKLDDDITHFALKAFVCELDALALTDSEASLVFVSPTITCGIAELSTVLKWPNRRKLFTLTCNNRTPDSSGYCVVFFTGTRNCAQEEK